MSIVHNFNVSVHTPMQWRDIHFTSPNTMLLFCLLAGAAAKSLQSCPIDGSPPASSVPGILQARALEWVANSFSNAWKWKVKVKLLSRVRRSDPRDYSLPGSSVHGILQARVLEWGAIAFSVSVSLCSCKPHSSFTPISQVNSSIFSFYAPISTVDTLVIKRSFLKLIFIVFFFCWTLNLWTVSP